MKIKKATRHQNHATTAERLLMIERFRRSGLTRAAFSQQHGIPLATLSWWLKKTKRAPNLPVPVVFSEVMLPPAKSQSKPGFFRGLRIRPLRPEEIVEEIVDTHRSFNPRMVSPFSNAYSIYSMLF